MQNMNPLRVALSITLVYNVVIDESGGTSASAVFQIDLYYSVAYQKWCRYQKVQPIRQWYLVRWALVERQLFFPSAAIDSLYTPFCQ